LKNVPFCILEVFLSLIWHVITKVETCGFPANSIDYFFIILPTSASFSQEKTRRRLLETERFRWKERLENGTEKFKEKQSERKLRGWNRKINKKTI